MAGGPSEVKDPEGGRLGGARADFVASLGRKVKDAGELVTALEDDPTSRGARDELRRRLHALGAGARMLRFEAMARSIAEALTVLDRASHAGALREQDVVFVGQVIDDLPALAWGDQPPRDHAPASEEGEDAGGALPVQTLVVGPEDLADALTEDTASAGRTFECERSEDAQTALEMARAYAPDVMLIDADVPRASELVEALLDDPLTEPVPIVVVGTFRTPDEAAYFVALGVAKALPKPVVPAALRRVMDEILDARDGRTMRVTLGEPTLEQLADRLATELKRALVDSVDRPALSCRVPLGEGTEVLGALWGAIARVQEIVTQRTGGAVRFGGDAPEGAIALAPWLHQDLAAADRLSGRGRGAAADVRLQGRRVLVADDDPGVTWFIADLLRTAGCEVHEALDGTTALETAFRVQPELVVSDILMPGMDGFALCRALRRDVALRDTPVILLSWKEDLLQRVRELGASAAAYMRKESDSRAILARVREVLRPRARIEMRLRGDGEVRGRLDGLTPRLLLELVGAIRVDARLGVRDASYLYEIEVRAGAPRKATRTAADGGYVRGEKALASLLGVGSGRFVISGSVDPVRGELQGTLTEQLARPIAAARAAFGVTTGARTVQVERIAIDETALEEYLRVTPDPARSLVRRIAGGESPRQMILAGEAPPSLLDDVLGDLASRGAITGVEGAGGADLLRPAVEAARALLQRAPPPTRATPPNARPSVMPAPVVVRAPAPPETTAVTKPPPPPTPSQAPASAPMLEEGDAVPSSLEDAVMRELSDRSPAPGAARVPTSNPPPLIEPSQLRPRSSNPPAEEEAAPESASDERLPLPSLPPDAIVPESSSGEELAAAPVSLPPAAAVPVETTDALPPVAPVEPVEPVEPESDRDVDAEYEALLLAATPAADDTPATPAIEKTQPLGAAPAMPPARPAPVPPTSAPPKTRPATPVAKAVSAQAETTTLEKTLPLAAAPPAPAKSAPPPPSPDAETAPPEKPARSTTITDRPSRLRGKPATPAAATAPSSRGWLGWVVVLVSAAAIAYVALSSRAAPPAPEPGVQSSEVLSAPTPSPAPSEAASVAAVPAPPSDELPPGADVPAGYGLVAVSCPAGARVRIDGAIAGNGPSVSLVAGVGTHEVRVEVGGQESRSVIDVRAGKTARVDSAP